MSNLKPAIKWAGGKRSIMRGLIANFPQEFGNYFEPFVGGGSVFMELVNDNRLENKQVYLGDIMQPLVNMYCIIKDRPDELIDELGKERYKNTKEQFTLCKERFNSIKHNIGEHAVEGAALFIYLNKIGFNGMYRENKSGQYNIPFGKQANPTICNPIIIQALSNYLRKPTVTLNCGSYIECENNVQSGDFVYLDPPYYDTFTGYNSSAFGEVEQRSLRDFYARLTTKGCKVALSNSNHQFIRDLYGDIPGVRFIEIEVKRMINSKGDERKNVKTELLVTNY